MFAESAAFSGYSVTNLDEATTFYRDTLGCSVKEDRMGMFLTFPNGHSVFIYPKEDHQPATFTVLNFPVPSIDDALAQLKEKGVEMIHYDTLPIPASQDELGVLRGKAANMGPDIAWFTDPSGNVLAVLEN